MQEKEKAISGDEPAGMLECVCCVSLKLAPAKPRIYVHAKARDLEGLPKGRLTTVVTHLESIVKFRGTTANVASRRSQDVSTPFKVGPLSSNMEVGH
jgi:hypothetical protein